MAGTKGYSSYRGRGSKWKILIALILLLVIAAAASVIYLQQYLVYGADGRRWLDLPWWQTEKEDASPAVNEQDPELGAGVDIVVQEPEEPEPKAMVVRSLASAPLTQADWEAFKAASIPAGEEDSAVAVRLKIPNGTVYFESASAVSGTVKVAREAGETAAALSALTSEEGLHTIAVMSCLQDYKAANTNAKGRGLRNKGGYIFYDGSNSLWLDPTKPAAREYVCAIAREIAELGFDELLLTDFCYPTVGRIDRINYNSEEPLEDNLDVLLGELITALEPYDILLSVEIPEAVISTGPDTTAGLNLSRLVGKVDRLYAVTTPEKAEALSDLVARAAEGAGGETVFIPELTADSPALTGSRLILAEE